MSVEREVQKLENDVFQLIEAAYAAISIREYQLAKLHITALEDRNKEYKEITQQDCVSPDRVLNIYERLWEKQNA